MRFRICSSLVYSQGPVNLAFTCFLPTQAQLFVTGSELLCKDLFVGAISFPLTLKALLKNLFLPSILDPQS